MEGMGAEDDTEEEEEAEDDWKPLVPVVVAVVAVVAVVVVVVIDGSAGTAVIDDVELSSGRLTGIEEGGEGEGTFDGGATVIEFKAECEGD